MNEPSFPDSSSPAITQGFYNQLRAVADRVFSVERSGHTLQPTAVVNEACMRLLSSGMPDLPRDQQLAIAARVLKQVLIDHARTRDADKRGGGVRPLNLELDPQILADNTTLIDFHAIRSALEKLRSLSERQAEVVTLRVFAGMQMDQIASALNVSKRSVEGDWTVARAWLRRELASAIGASSP
ncbi:MAG TPA: ECF-type sigma factor [Phycisphaerales bacterium]|nr:ECF-type sigma factor [Phycisphaerales bacterium]